MSLNLLWLNFPSVLVAFTANLIIVWFSRYSNSIVYWAPLVQQAIWLSITSESFKIRPEVTLSVHPFMYLNFNPCAISLLSLPDMNQQIFQDPVPTLSDP